MAHTAIREAEVAINHILGVEDRMNYNSVPGVVYTNPEVAGVGKTEEEPDQTGHSLSCYEVTNGLFRTFCCGKRTGKWNIW